MIDLESRGPDEVFKRPQNQTDAQIFSVQPESLVNSETNCPDSKFRHLHRMNS